MLSSTFQSQISRIGDRSLVSHRPESRLPRLTAAESCTSCTPCMSNETYNYFPEIMDVMLFRAVKP